jgi:hypothetical protein
MCSPGRRRVPDLYVGGLTGLALSDLRPLDWICIRSHTFVSINCGAYRWRIVNLCFSLTPWDMSKSVSFMMLVEAEKVNRYNLMTRRCQLVISS